MSSQRVKAYCSIRTLTLYVLACEKMTSTEGVVVFNDEKGEQRGGDPFDIFSIPVINDDYEKYVDLYVEPLSHITQTGPLVFKWNTLGGEKWDSSKTEAEIHYSIVKANGDPTTDADNLSVINSLPIANFSNIELKMNDKIVTNSSSGNHAYHAYLMQKSSYSKDVKKEVMKKTEGYFEEEGDNMNQFEFKKDITKNPATIINDVFKKKHDMFVSPANDVVTRTQLYLDLTQVPQYYPTDIDYVMTFTRNPESFCLMSKSANDGKYKIVIKRMRLIIRKIVPAYHMIKRETQLLHDDKRKAFIPFTHTCLTTRLLQAHTQKQTFLDVCGTLPSLPKQLFVFMVDHTAFVGK